MITAEWLGLAAFTHRLATMGRKVKAATQEQLEEAGEELADAIRGEAPVGERGALRDSVRSEPHPSKELTVRVRAGGTPETTHRAKNGVEYDEALLIEYGTHRSAAQPFFYTTARRELARIRKKIGVAAQNAAETE